MILQTLERLGFYTPYILFFLSLIVIKKRNVFFYYYVGGFFLNYIFNVLLKGFLKQPRPDSNVELYTFDIDNDRDFVVSELGIRSVPTIKGFNDGKEIYHNVGVLRKEQIMEVINKIK